MGRGRHARHHVLRQREDAAGDGKHKGGEVLREIRRVVLDGRRQALRLRRGEVVGMFVRGCFSGRATAGEASRGECEAQGGASKGRESAHDDAEVLLGDCVWRRRLHGHLSARAAAARNAAVHVTTLTMGARTGKPEETVAGGRDQRSARLDVADEGGHEVHDAQLGGLDRGEEAEERAEDLGISGEDVLGLGSVRSGQGEFPRK